MGGSTDIEKVFKKYGGLVLGGSIDKYVYLLCRELPPFHKYKSRIVYSEIELVDKNSNIEHIIVKKTIKYLGLSQVGLEIATVSDLPSSCGIGSSSSFTVGLLNCLVGLQGKRLTPEELRVGSTFIERKLANEAGGFQDQSFAAYGGFNLFEFNKDGFKANRITAKLDNLDRHMLLLFTGGQRRSADVSKTYRFDKKNHRKLLRLTEKGLKAIEMNDMALLGKLIGESWSLKRELSDRVSSSGIDELYNIAMSNGSYGGKISGAGGGGVLMLIAPPEKHKDIVRKTGLLPIPITFSHKGSEIIYHGR